MISPRKWILKRPGIFIPVFFLALVHAKGLGQVLWQEAASAALGGCFLTIQGYSCANQNPGGLGLIEQSSISIQHSRPYMIKELGSSSISGQFTTGTGAIGIAMSTQGLRSFRQSSLWFSYGMKLHSGISAGAGIHLWSSSLPEQLFYAPGCSFALGLKISLNDQWKLGARLFHPAGWSAHPDLPFRKQMVLAAGCSFSFLQAGIFYTELHARPAEGIVMCGGLEWNLSQHTLLRTGISTKPFLFSWGISINFTRWIADFAFLYRTDSGLSPYTSLTHAW